jgi:hypothetical protein
MLKGIQNVDPVVALEDGLLLVVTGCYVIDSAGVFHAEAGHTAM